MTEFFDTEKLIVEVERRPAFYNTHLPEYSDKLVKEKLWTEVCDAIVPNWGQADRDGKIKRDKNVIYSYSLFEICTLLKRSI
jgi:hypothetical protein